MMDCSTTENRAAVGYADRRMWPWVVASVVSCAGVLLSALLFAELRRHERQHLEDDFARAAQDRVSAIKRTMELDAMIVTSIRSFYDASNDVDRGEFRIFTASLFENRPSIRTLEWVPRVPESQRKEYEAAARKDGCEGFRINEHDQKGNSVPASRREDYSPVFYVEPGTESLGGLGFDLATDPLCRDAMDRACSTKQLVSSPRVALDAEEPGQFGLRFFLPVYRKNAPLRTVEDRRKNLEGFVVGVLRVSGIMDEALSGLSPASVHVALFDLSACWGQRVLFWHTSRTTPADAAPDDPETFCLQSPLHKTSCFELADRQWSIDCGPTADFMAEHMTWRPWAAALGGLVMTGLLATYLAGTAILSARTSRLADQLAKTNRQWENEFVERRRAEVSLRTSETKYKTLHDSSADAIMLAMPQEGFLSANRLQEDLLLPGPLEEKLQRIPCTAEALVESPHEPRPSTGNDLAGVRILLAEDGFDNQQLIQAVLRKAGAHVEIAENGRVAVDKAEAGQFDVILMDMNMPEMDGYQATRSLRDRGYQGPILALTANAMSGDAQRSLEAGCNDHLTKPIDRARLTETIARFAGRVAAQSGPSPPPRDEPPSDGADAIVSQFADDPEIAAILEQFVAGLAKQVHAMRQALSDCRFDNLRRAAHRMKGSGGSYGYPVLTDAAKALEQAAENRDAAAALSALDHVAALCQAIERGRNLHPCSERSKP